MFYKLHNIHSEMNIIRITFNTEELYNSMFILGKFNF